MSILKTLEQARIGARKLRQMDAVGFFSYMIAEIQKIGKNNGNRETTDIEAIKVIRKSLDIAKENLKISHDNPAAVETYKFEIEMLEELLPEQMSDEQLAEFITNEIQSSNFTSLKDLGKVLSKLKETRGGEYNPQLAADITKSILNCEGRMK